MAFSAHVQFPLVYTLPFSLPLFLPMTGRNIAVLYSYSPATDVAFATLLPRLRYVPLFNAFHARYDAIDMTHCERTEVTV